MAKRHMTRAARHRRQSRYPLLALVLLCAAGCAESRRDVQTDNPALAAYIQLIMPARIEVQRSWTKPVSLAGDGDADALEVLLAAYDSFDDLTKIAGTLHFELHTRRKASADRHKTRIAFWSVELNSRESLTRFWDPLVRFYRFHLRLADHPLPGGRYILSVRLMAPDNKRLFDEYEFAYQPGTAPPASPLPSSPP